jgi:opacity protein-like surface antigen
LRHHLLAGVGILALIAAGPAGAADQALPLKAPPAATWSWSGFYLGAHGGYGWGHDRFSNLNDHDPFFDVFFSGKFPNFFTTGFDSKGLLGGFQAGANWQSGAVVGGLEIDLSGTDIKGSKTTLAGPTGNPLGLSTATWTNSDKFALLGSGRARLGYVAWPNVLLYGTGGLAWTRLEQTAGVSITSINPAPPPASNSETASIVTPGWRFGWVAGIGGEARISDTNWLVRLEYLHYDFGDSGSFSSSASNTSVIGGRVTADVVRAGLSYKFEGGIPFAAAAAPGPMMYKAPVRIAAPWSWSGFYLGAHGGYGWGHDPFDKSPVGVPLSGVDSRGFVAGFQAGGNWQSGAFVGGLELDLSGTGIKGSGSGTTTTGLAAVTVSTATQSDNLDLLGSARARLGYLATPSVLLYGTGGLAWTHFIATTDTSQTTGGGAPVTTSTATPTWELGWVAGIGIETRLGDSNWLARIEYLHYDFGDSGGASEVDTSPGGAVTFVSSTTSGRLTTDVVRAALSYKLDWPPAGPARAAMSVKAPVAAAWSWNGFYLGGHGGYGRGQDPFSEPLEFGIPGILTLTGIDLKGLVGGFQAGGNWQTGAFVGGLELDLSGTRIKGSTSNQGTDTFFNIGNTLTATRSEKFDLLGSARARLGYLATPTLLFYGTGGLAWTRLDTTVDTLGTTPNGNQAISTSTPSWRFGWVAGAGAQTRLGDSNWLARVEYLHYDFGDSGSVAPTSFFADGALAFATASGVTTGHLTADVVRAGLDYKLN